MSALLLSAFSEGIDYSDGIRENEGHCFLETLRNQPRPVAIPLTKHAAEERRRIDLSSAWGLLEVYGSRTDCEPIDKKDSKIVSLSRRCFETKEVIDDAERRGREGGIVSSLK